MIKEWQKFFLVNLLKWIIYMEAEVAGFFLKAQSELSVSVRLESHKNVFTAQQFNHKFKLQGFVRNAHQMNLNYTRVKWEKVTWHGYECQVLHCPIVVEMIPITLRAQLIYAVNWIRTGGFLQLCKTIHWQSTCLPKMSPLSWLCIERRYGLNDVSHFIRKAMIEFR